MADLHLWTIGPSIYAVELAVVTHDLQPPDHYKALFPADLGLAHANVEVHRCVHEDELDEAQARREKLAQNAG